MNRDNPPRASNDGAGELPELDLDEGEARMLQRSRSANARGARSQPPAPTPLAMQPLELIHAQPAIELDTASGQWEARYRPAVRGVTCGTPPEASEPTAHDRSMAVKVAGYGPVPKEIWRWGIYAYSVFRRKRELEGQVAALQRSVEQSFAAYEKAVLALVDRVRTMRTSNAEPVSIGSMRAAAAQTGQKLSRPPQGSAGAAERSVIEATFRVLDDTKSFGREWDAARREIDLLQSAAEDKQRLVRRHELAIQSFDSRAMKLGIASYVAAAILLLLIVFAQPIARRIWPTDPTPLPPLPAEMPAGKP